MPETVDHASKFVREAVIAYPELYFGKYIILAEGPSEEIVLPKIASALGLDIDRSFVCVVPLGVDTLIISGSYSQTSRFPMPHL